ncbi:hypothetical protein AB0I00_10005 [Streptomyces sp. NPDC050803]
MACLLFRLPVQALVSHLTAPSDDGTRTSYQVRVPPRPFADAVSPR